MDVFVRDAVLRISIENGIEFSFVWFFTKKYIDINSFIFFSTLIILFDFFCLKTIIAFSSSFLLLNGPLLLQLLSKKVKSSKIASVYFQKRNTNISDYIYFQKCCHILNSNIWPSVTINTQILWYFVMNVLNLHIIFSA